MGTTRGMGLGGGGGSVRHDYYPIRLILTPPQ